MAQQINVKNYTVQLSDDGRIFADACTVAASSYNQGISLFLKNRVDPQIEEAVLKIAFDYLLWSATFNAADAFIPFFIFFKLN